MMTEKQMFTEAFSIGIYELIKAYNKAKTGSHLQKKLKEAAKDALRKWSDTLPSYISEKAKELADKCKVDLSTTLWPGRDKCGKTDSKSNLVWDHTTPLKELFNILIKCKTLKCVTDILNSYSGVCWITREEDNRLNNAGYKDQRPSGWEKCYEKCGIEIIELQQFSLHFDN